MFKVIYFTITMLFLLLTEAVYAQPTVGLDMDRPDRGMKVNLGNPASTIGTIFTNVIVIFFTVGAIGFVVMFLWGAVNWILSGGDKEKIAGARKRITTAIVGLVLLSLTFVITLVIGQILGLKALSEFKFEIPKLTQQR